MAGFPAGFRIWCWPALVLALLPAACLAEVRIVLGSFSTVENARQWLDLTATRVGEPLEVVEAKGGHWPLFRVATGPVSDTKAVRLKLQRIRRLGFADAWLELGAPRTAGRLALVTPADEVARVKPALAGGDDAPEGPIEAGPGSGAPGLPAAAPPDTGSTQVAELDAALLAGFDDVAVAASASTTPSWFELDGQLALNGAWTYDLDPDSAAKAYDGLSKLQAVLRLRTDLSWRRWRLRLEGKAFDDLFYDLEGRGHFTPAVLSRHSREALWHEVYLQGDLGDHVDVKTGRQIQSWGRADNLRVLDRLNPLDLREPGSADIEDMRLPVNMTRLRYHRGFLTLEGMAVHEIRFNTLPAPGSEFLLPSVVLPREVVPRDALAAEHAFSALAVFSGWDLSLHHARLYDDNPWLALTPAGAELRHSRLVLNGLAFNRVLGPWLFKGELAKTANHHYTVDPGRGFDRMEYLLGIEFSGWNDTTIGFESSLTRLRDRPGPVLPVAGPARDLWQSAFRLSRSFFNERLKLLLVGLFQGRDLDEGHVLRFMAEYQPRDRVTTALGFVLYGDGDSSPGGAPLFDTLDDRDRILFSIRYHF